MIDIAGWLGFGILMYSYFQKDILRLRWFIIGACFFLGISAFDSRNWPLFATQFTSIIINLYMIWKEGKVR